MKRIASLCSIILLLQACVSFKMTIPDEPDELVDYIAICKKIDKERSFEKEILSETINRSDSVVYAVIKVNNISKRLTLQWMWYTPKGEMVKLSKTLEVNKNEKFLEFFVAWDTLGNDHFKDQPGNWTVAVTCNERFLYKKEFEIH